MQGWVTWQAVSAVLGLWAREGGVLALMRRGGPSPALPGAEHTVGSRAPYVKALNASADPRRVPG